MKKYGISISNIFNLESDNRKINCSKGEKGCSYNSELFISHSQNRLGCHVSL